MHDLWVVAQYKQEFVYDARCWVISCCMSANVRIEYFELGVGLVLLVASTFN